MFPMGKLHSFKCMKRISGTYINNVFIRRPFIYFLLYYIPIIKQYHGISLTLMEGHFRSTQRAVLQKSCSVVGVLLGKLIHFSCLAGKMKYI